MDVERYRSPFDLEDYALIKMTQSELDTLRFELSIVLAKGAVLPVAEAFLAETDF